VAHGIWLNCVVFCSAVLKYFVSYSGAGSAGYDQVAVESVADEEFGAVPGGTSSSGVGRGRGLRGRE